MVSTEEVLDPWEAAAHTQNVLFFKDFLGVFVLSRAYSVFTKAFVCLFLLFPNKHSVLENVV